MCQRLYGISLYSIEMSNYNFHVSKSWHFLLVLHLVSQYEHQATATRFWPHPLGNHPFPSQNLKITVTSHFMPLQSRSLSPALLKTVNQRTIVSLSITHILTIRRHLFRKYRIIFLNKFKVFLINTFLQRNISKPENRKTKIANQTTTAKTEKGFGTMNWN